MPLSNVTKTKVNFRKTGAPDREDTVSMDSSVTHKGRDYGALPLPTALAQVVGGSKQGARDIAERNKGTVVSDAGPTLGLNARKAPRTDGRVATVWSKHVHLEGGTPSEGGHRERCPLQQMI